MNINLILLIDFSNKDNSNSQYNNSNQKILSFCSMIIGLILRKNLNQRIAVIINRGGNAEQICHFSNDICHHIQGLKRILKASVYGKKNIKSCIILAIRLINFTNQKNNSEILFISPKCDSDISIHFLGANLIKNQIKFSTIEFEKKSFIFETISKLTGGFYINYNLEERNETFFWFKNRILKNVSNFNNNYLSLCIKKIKCFGIQTKKKDYIKLKILNYCPLCQTITFGSKLCINCGLLFLGNFFYKLDNFKNFDLNVFEKFSIFDYEHELNIMIFLHNTFKI
nr:hypothetical protein CcurKRNrm2_p026 [Cryptomonas curvata]